MSTPDELLRALAAETKADPGVVTRLERRLLGPGLAVDALLRQHPDAAHGASARVEARLRKSVGVRERIPTWVRLLPAAGSVVAAAGVAAVVAGYIVWGGPSAPPAELAAVLQSPESWRSETPAEGVAFTYEGNGTVGGTAKAPRIAWEAGTIHVEVQHDAGIDLRVETREAEVRVVGTGFTVQRDALGTQVEVRHGRVAVRCEGSAEDRFIDAGDVALCLPRSAAGLLARAEAQHEAGASAAEVLATLDAAVATGGEGAMVDEVLAVRAGRRAEAGLEAEALADARAVLSHPDTPRAGEMRRLAAMLGLKLEGCAGALPQLEVLAQEGDASARGWIDACKADPTAANGEPAGR